jgi:hypothetical protein
MYTTIVNKISILSICEAFSAVFYISKKTTISAQLTYWKEWKPINEELHIQLRMIQEFVNSARKAQKRFILQETEAHVAIISTRKSLEI